MIVCPLIQGANDHLGSRWRDFIRLRRTAVGLVWQKLYCGDVAQLGERGVRNAEVRGSSPLISTKIIESPEYLNKIPVPVYSYRKSIHKETLKPTFTLKLHKMFCYI